MRFPRLVFGTFILAALAATTFVLARDGHGQNTRRPQNREAPAAKSPQAEQPAANPAAAENPQTIPGQQAAKSGFTTCLGTLEAAARGMVQNSPYSAASGWDTEAADSRAFTAVLAIEQPASLGLLTVSPSKGGCDAVATQIAYFSESCIAVREARLQGWKLIWDAKTLFGYQSPDSHLIYLMPSAAGCVAIEQRVQYDAAAGNKGADKK
ncbi:MAG: hypothetical protein ACM3O6_02150 [Acidobacteriota bacterium]